ncbi:MAG TPA: hypothetical protein VEJ23_05190, partial [Solirubrobacteraceae bacterium]|nr:hypothetical protein [Solirubrobacteraceae bacterium]
HPPATPGRARGSQQDAFTQALASLPGMSLAIMSAAQGQYARPQLLLDITQGARVASSSYARPLAQLSVLPRGGGAVVPGFATARRRAEDAPQLLRPGLLAASTPGGCGYVGVIDALGALVCANQRGQIATLSLGSAQTLRGRIAAMRARTRMVVAELPGGVEGYADLRALNAGRRPGELMLVVQLASAPHGHELLWAAAAGLPGATSALSSQSTRQRGLISAIDLGPTILRRLGVARLPADMRGQPVRTDGPLHLATLRALMARLRVIGARRTALVLWMLGAWALLVLACTGRRSRAWALRAGGVGVLWAPVVALVPAALSPPAAIEYATIALACLALGALTDRLLRWPRAPLAPALAAIVALTVDALVGTQLLMRSLLGPDPALGARFYGIGNELKSGLAVLVLAGVASLLYPAPPPSDKKGAPRVAATPGALARWRRRAVTTIAGAGIALGIIEGSARIGAGVGSVILVGAGFAVACAMLLEGTPWRRRALLVLASPLVALLALAALDLATAHGAGHFTGSILHARSPADLRDVIVRRYRAAWGELGNHAMPYLTAVSLVCAGLGLRYRRRLLAPVDGDPIWAATLAGGLTAGAVGAFVEDSGPVLLVVAVLALGCVLAYLWGAPAPSADASEHYEGAADTVALPTERELVLENVRHDGLGRAADHAL